MQGFNESGRETETRTVKSSEFIFGIGSDPMMWSAARPGSHN